MLHDKVLQRMESAARASRSLWPSPLNTGTLARRQCTPCIKLQPFLCIACVAATRAFSRSCFSVARHTGHIT